MSTKNTKSEPSRSQSITNDRQLFTPNRHACYEESVDRAATVSDLANTWLAGKVDLKPSTAERYAGIVREHIEPRWGSVRLADVTHSGVQAWVGGLTAIRSAVGTEGPRRSLADPRLRRERRPSRPQSVRGHHAASGRDDEHVYLTHQQVDDLAEACGEYRLAVLFLAYTGIRFGELAALRVGRLDPMRRRATIAESVTEVSGRGLVWGTPKGHDGRDVPIHRFLVDELAVHVAGQPR